MERLEFTFDDVFLHGHCNTLLLSLGHIFNNDPINKSSYLFIVLSPLVATIIYSCLCTGDAEHFCSTFCKSICSQDICL